jgi:hypothetical protein
MTTDTDALSELCATERDTEVPPPNAVDAGWTRLEAALWPGGGGSDPSSEPASEPASDPAAGSGGAAGSASAPASAAASMSIGTKVAALLALTAVAGVGALTLSSGDEARTEPAIASAPRDAPSPAIERDEAPRLRAADPEPPQVATPEPEPGPEPEPEAEADTRTAAPSSRRHTAALPDVPGEGLAHEVAILREASAALAAGKPSAALRWVRRHAADHPTGSLTEERLATEAIARCQLHDRRAAAIAAAFLERHPRSTHEGRVRAACETLLAR